MKFSLISAALLCFSACVSAIPINFEEVDGLIERCDSTFLVNTLLADIGMPSRNSFRSYEMDDEVAIREWQQIEARTVSNPIWICCYPLKYVPGSNAQTRNCREKTSPRFH